MRAWLRENWGPVLIALVILGAMVFDSIHGPMNFGCGFSIDSRPTEEMGH